MIRRIVSGSSAGSSSPTYDTKLSSSRVAARQASRAAPSMVPVKTEKRIVTYAGFVYDASRPQVTPSVRRISGLPGQISSRRSTFSPACSSCQAASKATRAPKE